MSDCDRPRRGLDSAFNTSRSKFTKVLLMNKILNLAAADQRQNLRAPDLLDQFAEHRAGRIAPNQPGTDYDRAERKGDPFRFEFGFAIQRPAAFIGADG